MATDKQLIGAAGEHLVLSRLLARELLASQAPRGTRKADILVNPLDGGMPRLIQVKTRAATNETLNWAMTSKSESISENDLFYCFVHLDLINPSVYVVPSKLVSEVITKIHSEWLGTPGKNGQAHNENNFRSIKNDYGKNYKSVSAGWMDEYLENWDLLL